MTPDFYKNILDNLFDGVYFVDLERRITYWNRAAERISGYQAGDVLGHHCAHNLLKHISHEGIELCRNNCPLAQTLADGQLREAEVYLHHKDGHRVPVAVRISPLRDETGRITGAVEVFSAAAANVRLLQAVDELKNQTLTDPLTGLGNRKRAALEFKRWMGELQRSGVAFGLLFADIDDFKNVNDAHGHDCGDRVLAQVAKTLQSALRGLDCVCRWGGEEFVVLVPKVNATSFGVIAERMRRFAESTPVPSRGPAKGPENCQADGTMLAITLSIGGALARPGDTLGTLAARADAMMYRAKRLGKNRVVLDCPSAEENTFLA